MLKRCRKMITNRVPRVFEKDCFSNEEILFKTEHYMLHVCYGATAKKINNSKTVHGYNDDNSKKVVYHHFGYI